jgi:hypothetical protein
VLIKWSGVFSKLSSPFGSSLTAGMTALDELPEFFMISADIFGVGVGLKGGAVEFVVGPRG